MVVDSSPGMAVMSFAGFHLQLPLSTQAYDCVFETMRAVILMDGIHCVIDLSGDPIICHYLFFYHNHQVNIMMS